MTRTATIALLRLGRTLLSLGRGPACRFTPSCSEYAHEAVARYGVRAGLYKSAKRLLRCHPFGGAGLDPVQ